MAAKSDFLSVTESLERILADVTPLAAETIDLDLAQNRYLSAPLSARLTQPPFDASAMDGYAVRQADVTAAGVKLAIKGVAAAGHPFDGAINSGECLRIFTGAPLPEGADAVVIQENTELLETPADEPTPTADADADEVSDVRFVTITDPAIDQGYVRPRGFDFAEGDKLLPAGRKLGAREQSLAAAMGHGVVGVVRRPKVAILSTGDELVPPGGKPGPGQIVSSNHLGVAALVRMAGGDPLYLGIARDTAADLNAHLDRAKGADVLVTIGGASVGDHDLVGPILKQRGLDLAFWKIAMRPGKPLMFGRLGAQRVIGLPGNPVSSLICARVFLVPLVQKLLGRQVEDEQATQAVLTTALPANGPRQHYMRATSSLTGDGIVEVTPIRSQDSSLLSAFAQSDCLILRKPHAVPLAAGAPVTILPLDF